MNLSNKILIGFFGLAFLYLTAVFAEVRFRGTTRILNDENSIAETVDLSGVSYVVLQNIAEPFHLAVSDQPRLEIRSFAGDLLQNAKYTVAGDTLIVSQFQVMENERLKVTLFVSPTSFKGISVVDAAAIINDVDLKQLFISQKSAQVWIDESTINSLRIEASGGSFLNISAAHLDTVSVSMESSEAYIQSPVGVLRGSMENNSLFQAGGIEEIRFKKDNSSSLRLY